MEQYRKKIKSRMFLCGIVAAVSVGISIFHQSKSYELMSINIQYEELAGFQLGLIMGFGFLALILMYKYGKAMKDETKLQILYNKEHDERQSLIRQKAGMPMIMFTSGIMIFAGMIAGYYNVIVFSTLILAAIIQLTIGAIVKIYYMKKI